jgi:shikimate 5-dehydrogenase
MLDPEIASQIGAVNTVWLERRPPLMATNTDSLRILGEPR